MLFMGIASGDLLAIAGQMVFDDKGLMRKYKTQHHIFSRTLSFIHRVVKWNVDFNVVVTLPYF